MVLCFVFWGSDKPIIESLSPHQIDQSDALEKQFEGMSDIPFSYSDYEEARHHLVQMVNDNLTEEDKRFLVSLSLIHISEPTRP